MHYGPGLCPENHQKTFVGLNLCAHEFTDEQVDHVIAAFSKVWSSMGLSAL